MPDAKPQATKSLTQRATEGIQSIVSNNQLKPLLDTMSKFHAYSLNNNVLIHSQNPNANNLANFNSWKQQDRQIKAGEKSIEIIGFSEKEVQSEVLKYDAQGNAQLDQSGKHISETVIKKIPVYETFRVFDVSQTLGKEPAKIPVYEQSPKLAETVNKSLPDVTKFNTPEQKLVAESVAYTVSKHFGVDTSKMDLPNVAALSSNKDFKELYSTLNKIHSQAHDLIWRIDGKLKELQITPTMQPLQAVQQTAAVPEKPSIKARTNEATAEAAKRNGQVHEEKQNSKAKTNDRGIE